MFPLNIDVNKYKQSTKDAEKQNKENKKKQTSCSQQALSNQLVLGSMPSNPNSGQLQQQPARQ